MPRPTRKERYARNHDRELAYAKQYREDNKDKLREYNRLYRLSHKEYIRVSNEKWRFENRERRLVYMKQYHAEKYHKRYHGLDRAEYDRLCIAQEGLCRICTRKKRLIVDHCHRTGEIRGLLCRSCNTALGLLDDKCDLFHRAVAYLERRLA